MSERRQFLAQVGSSGAIGIPLGFLTVAVALGIFATGLHLVVTAHGKALQVLGGLVLMLAVTSAVLFVAIRIVRNVRRPSPPGRHQQR